MLFKQIPVILKITLWFTARRKKQDFWTVKNMDRKCFKETFAPAIFHLSHSSWVLMRIRKTDQKASLCLHESGASDIPFGTISRVTSLFILSGVLQQVVPMDRV